jgi:hypothetical protein
MADITIMRHVYIRHQQAVFSDSGIASELEITPVQGAKFANDCTTAYFQCGRFIEHNLGLRCCTDRCPIEDTALIANPVAV